MNRQWKNWTEEEEKRLVELYTSGTQINQIAQELERTAKAVERHYYELGHNKKQAFSQKLIERAKDYEKRMDLHRTD